MDSSINMPELVDQYLASKGRKKLRKSGKNYIAHSPFPSSGRDSNPSFSLFKYNDLWFFKDFHANISGGPVTFVMHMEGCDEAEARRILHLSSKSQEESDTPDYGRELAELNTTYAEEAHRLLMANPDALRWLTSYPSEQYKDARFWSEEVIREFQIGIGPRIPVEMEAKNDHLLHQAGLLAVSQHGNTYCPYRDRVTFPFHHPINGKVMGFQARKAPWEGGDGPKFMLTTDTAIFRKDYALYGIFQNKKHIREKGEVILVEGQSDVIGLACAGIRNTVPESGKSASESRIKNLMSFTDKWLLWYDWDTGAQAAQFDTVKKLISLGETKVRIVYPNPDFAGLDPDVLRIKNGNDWVQELVGSAGGWIDYFVRSYDDSSYWPQASELKRACVGKLFDVLSESKEHYYAQAAIEEFAVKTKLNTSMLYQDFLDSQNASPTKTYVPKPEGQGYDTSSPYFYMAAAMSQFPEKREEIKGMFGFEKATYAPESTAPFIYRLFNDLPLRTPTTQAEEIVAKMGQVNDLTWAQVKEVTLSASKHHMECELEKLRELFANSELTFQEAETMEAMAKAMVDGIGRINQQLNNQLS